MIASFFLSIIAHKCVCSLVLSNLLENNYEIVLLCNALINSLLQRCFV